jgi:translation initiation factor 6
MQEKQTRQGERHILKTNFNGTPNVGLYGYATKEWVLLGEHLTEKLHAEVQESLGNVPIHMFRVAGTNMPGIFLAGNSTTLLVPGIAFDYELEQLKKLNIPFTIFKTRHTCLGNNIACNDSGAIISTDFDETERKFIENSLGVPTIRMDIAKLSTPGALIVLNGNRGIIHRDATQEEIKEAEAILHVKLEPATVNLGTPYLHAGILCSPYGFVIGDQSGGPEIVHIDEALGYMGDDE